MAETLLISDDEDRWADFFLRPVKMLWNYILKIKILHIQV